MIQDLHVIREQCYVALSTSISNASPPYDNQTLTSIAATHMNYF